MLVNLSCNPRSRTKCQKRYRDVMKRSFGRGDLEKEGRRMFKRTKRLYTFKGFFVPYRPMPWEYTKNTEEVYTGVYIVPGHNFIEEMVNNVTRQHARSEYDKESYESGDVWCSFGLCDNASQAIQFYNDRKAKGGFPGNHIITLTYMGKNSGWRWHKWGRYLGNFEPSREYFEDEEGIEAVWSFHIIRIR